MINTLWILFVINIIAVILLMGGLSIFGAIMRHFETPAQREVRLQWLRNHAAEVLASLPKK